MTHGTRHAIGGGIAALLALPLFVAGTSAQSGSATTYRFTTVVDSQRDGLRPTRCAAINDGGTVAVQVRNEALGINQLITKKNANDTPVVVADTQSVADFPSFCDNGITSIPSDPSINASGRVAFQGNLSRLTTRADCATAQQRERPRQAVLLGKSGPLEVVAHSINLPGGNFIAEFLVADQSVNNSGRVAIVPELDDTSDQGLFVAKNGTFAQRFLADTPTADGFNFNNLSSRVSLNEEGQVAFESGLNDSNVRGIFLSNPDGTFKTIVDNSGDLSTGDPSLNNSGVVAFTANRFDDDFNQIFSVNTSSGAGVTTVAESSPGGYSFFDEPSLNDLGQVAFTAEVQPDPNEFITFQGVFTGPDPVAHKVLQAGDLYEGAPVLSVISCSEALNNTGEIVMTVFGPEDPETFESRIFIVKATPVRNED
jgi:hypothetical protein